MAELVSIKRNVDVSPGQAAPAVFHCSQGDVGSKIILGLLNNGTAYSIPSGVTVTIEGSESNGSIFTPISATASGSDITFYLTGEMTAVAGPAICQAVLKSGSNILGTANFTLEVESSPMGADAPPVFTDAGWTWMLNKLTTEFVPALGDNIIDAIDSKADQSDLTTLSNTVAGHTGSITVLNNTVNNLNQSVTENRQNIATKLNKNQGAANAGKYLKVGADGNVETAYLDVTTDKTLSVADKAADAKAVGDEITSLKADLRSILERYEGLENLTSSATWEVGSIYANNGSNYNSIKYAIRTPNNQKIYLNTGAVAFTTNPLIQTLYLFQWGTDGTTFIGRVGTSGETKCSAPADGYYRVVMFAFDKSAVIDSDTMENYSEGLQMYGATLGELVDGITPESYANKYYGEKIDLSVHGFKAVSAGISLPPTSISTGLSSRQDFDIYGGVLFQLFSNNYVALVNLANGEVIASYAINCGHGNSCQFSNEFFEETDKYPLLYCFAYSENLVYVNRVTDTGATLIKTYRLETSGYRFSGGIDNEGKRLVTIHYKNDSSLEAIDNACFISVWDLTNVANGDNDELKPTLIKQTQVEFNSVVQGCAYFKSALYVTSGYYSKGSPVMLTAYNTDGDIISRINSFNNSIAHNEAEGISFYLTNGAYECYFSTQELWKLLFD